MERSLEYVFNPRSVAVIGASEVPGKASERRTRSLIEGGYRGDIYLINPKRSELFG
ncbi:MAG: acetyl CoA synthetase, partial [Deltaproteobacteria bacterium]